MKGDELAEAVKTLLEESDEGVLRIGVLHESLRMEFEYPYTAQTFRKHLTSYVDEQGDASEFTAEPSGYWALRGVDFQKWYSKNGCSRNLDKYLRKKLWAKAAGVCEFDDCTTDLTTDLLTRQFGNFGQIAHIVAASPDGPRGEEGRSTQLANDFSNLMLLCYKHHRLIDTRVEQYPEERLREMKREHEGRIAQILELSGARKTRLLLIYGQVGEQGSRIAEPEAAEAVNLQIVDDTDELDLDNALPNERDTGFWETGARIIGRHLRHSLAPQRDGKTSHLSVFAIAPIPFLILIGRLIGDKRPVDLFQFDRDEEYGERWSWTEDAPYSSSKVEVETVEEANPDEAVAIAVSVSASVETQQIPEAVGEPVTLYEITVDSPSRCWLQHRSQLEDFRGAYMSLIDDIEDIHGKDRRIHVFAATPAPIAIDVGRCLLPKVCPTLVTYDRVAGAFVRALEIPGNLTISALDRSSPQGISLT